MKVFQYSEWPMERGCVALIGAGGKTTTMLSIAQSVVDEGGQVLVTTTTKIRPPTAASLVLTDEETDVRTAIRAHFGGAPIVATGRCLGDRGKLLGLEPEEVCNLAGSGVADVVLCEADGAGGKPLKWHKPGEPVVPPCARLVVSIGGLDALGMTVSEIHRPEVFAESLDMDLSQTVGPLEMARALKATERYAPAGSELIYVLNKADNEEALAKARQVIDSMRDLGVTEPIICGRRGQIVEVCAVSNPAIGVES